MDAGVVLGANISEKGALWFRGFLSLAQDSRKDCLAATDCVAERESACSSVVTVVPSQGRLMRSGSLAVAVVGMMKGQYVGQLMHACKLFSCLVTYTIYRMRLSVRGKLCTRHVA